MCLQLVVSSDKLASVQELLLAVDLDIDGVGEDEGKSVLVEMNKDDLQKMIASLEAANKVPTENVFGFSQLLRVAVV